MRSCKEIGHGWEALVTLIVCPCRNGIYYAGFYFCRYEFGKWRPKGSRVACELGLNIFGSVIVATICMALSFVLFSSLRRFQPLIESLSEAVDSYSIPGTVIAIGCLCRYFSRRDGRNLVVGNGHDIGLWLTGSIAGIVFGCGRFVAVSNGMIRSGYERIPLALDDASLVLGQAQRDPMQRAFAVIIFQHSYRLVDGICGCDEGITNYIGFASVQL